MLGISQYVGRKYLGKKNLRHYYGLDVLIITVIKLFKKKQMKSLIRYRHFDNRRSLHNFFDSFFPVDISLPLLTLKYSILILFPNQAKSYFNKKSFQVFISPSCHAVDKRRLQVQLALQNNQKIKINKNL